MHKVASRCTVTSLAVRAVGTLTSTFWIVASNSWMQTPQAITVENGHVVPQDWFQIIFNPSFPYRLAHMGIAAFIAAALIGTVIIIPIILAYTTAGYWVFRGKVHRGTHD
ncbi:hypothetical protein LMG28727_06395 [Paraburkholderia kirstenboschensis]|nr:hypothetical protein LMG28727_06395 [Paraburkholderia kirstenboschensis]